MKKSTKIKLISVAVFLVLVFLLMLFLFSDENIAIFKSVFNDDDITKEEVQDRLSELGIRGYVTVAVLAMLQVVLTFLPAEPVQVLAGLTFGFPVGLLCCTVGVVLGNSVIYALYRVYGDKLNHYFDKKLHFDFEKLSKSGKITLTIFILYFLPAIPYGMICFFAATMRMKYPRYIIVTTLGAIPSVCIGVGLGHLAIASSWVLSLSIFAVLLIVLAVLMKKKDVLFEKLDSVMSGEKKEKEPYSSKTTVSFYKKSKLFIPYVISRIIFFLKGIKVKYTSKVGKVGEIEAPAIVLCNHGAFVDFAYAGTLLRKQSPNFPVARLYFYKKWVGNLLRSFGCFPKSMFALDMESVKNSLRVVKNGRVLAMMPEARLSTVGEFEDIQDGTFAFIKKAGVPVYKIKICGDYLAKPKWAKKMRRGSLIEAELDILFTKEELEAYSVEEIKARTENALYYNEFEWLKTRPLVKYRSRQMAEGLENILSKCPICKQKYTIYTKKRDVFCECCGKVASVDGRYNFVGATPFENFAEWYKWQNNELYREILRDENYALSAKVTLKHPSLDGKTFLRVSGEGFCTLDRAGLSYKGSCDGENVELHFPMAEIYRLLFGAGENFEIYQGQKMYFFVPEEPKSAVDFYVASKILKDLSITKN